jgi:hypothetical protein
VFDLSKWNGTIEHDATKETPGMSLLSWDINFACGWVQLAMKESAVESPFGTITHGGRAPAESSATRREHKTLHCCIDETYNSLTIRKSARSE